MKTLNISSDPTGVLDLVSIGIAIVDTSPRILEMNHTFCEMYGYSRIELLEMDLERLTASSNTRVFDQALRYIRAEEGFVETAIGVRRDGSRFFAELRGRPVAGVGQGAWVMEVRDISEQKVTESMLTESVRRYTDLYDNAPDMYVSVDAYTAIIRQCNATCARKLGYTKEEIVGRPIFDLYHSDCMPEVRASFQMFMTNGEVADTELQLMRKDGSTIDVSLSVTAVRNEAGEILYSRSAWRDITEKKRARELLKQEKEKLKEALREIRKLNGLLPICASCKKIRDDRGYWRQIESYIVEHSEAMFSHSICPDCRVQLYPRPTDTDEGSIES